MNSLKRILLATLISLAGIGLVEAKYQIFSDTIGIGDSVKPETGAIFAVQSTTETSLPCPKMTEVQRDALAASPVGSCVFNTTSGATEFWNGSAWIKAGSSAVISEWVTGTFYGVGSFVYTTPDFKLYLANTAHTAGATFAGDIANWDEASDDLDRLTSSTDNAILRFDGTTGGLVQDSSLIIDDTNNLSGIVNLTATGTTTLNTGLTGFLKAVSGLVSAQALIDLTTDMTGVLPIANGGTNSSTVLANDRVIYSQAGAVVESSVTLNSTGDMVIDGSLVVDGLVKQTGLGESTYFGDQTGIVDDLSNNFNAGFGFQSLKSNTTGQGNTAIGHQTLENMTTGIWNTALGHDALKASTTQSNNTAVGSGALQSNFGSAGKNTAVGSDAMRISGTSQQNVALGYGALRQGSSYQTSTAIGTEASYNMSAGADNVALGYRAGYGASGTRDRNIFIGANTAPLVTSGSDNILLGDGLSLPTDTTSNYLSIDDLIYGDLTNKRVGINVIAPTVDLDVLGDTLLTGNLTTTGITTSGSIVASPIYGSAAVSGNLNIGSTSDATKGFVDFGTVSPISGMRFDETNSRLSVGGSETSIAIGGTTFGSKLSVHSEGATDLADVAFERHTDSASLSSHLVYARSRGTDASEAIVASGDALSRVFSVGYDGTDYGLSTEIRSEVDGTPGVADMPGRILFLTSADGTETPTERMRIASDGKVSITGSLDVISTTEGSLPCPSMTEVQRDAIATPSAGDCVYNSTASKLNYYDGGIWGELGSGGAGGVNYIDNTDIESNTTGYNTYLDAAGTIPVDGTGGTSAVFLFKNTTTPLMDAADLKLAVDAVNRQGNGFSYDFTIDNGQQAKKLIISFEYDASDFNYVDDDIGIFIYDVTNAKLIRINGENLKGGKGTHYAQFQTAPDSKSYRLIFHVASTNATAYDVYFDNISVGPQIINHGAIVTDWEAFTPTSGWNNGTHTGQFRRIGDSAEIQYKLVFTGTPTTSGNFNLPSGLSVDTLKLTSNIISMSGELRDSSVGVYPIIQANQSSNSFFLTTTTSSTTDAVVGLTYPFTFVSGDSISITVKVPIVGWGSTAKMSSDFSGRDIYFHAYRSANQTISGSGTVNFDAELSDSTSHYDTSTYTYTIPETGRYLFSAGLEISVTPTAGQVIALDFKVNGTDTYRIFRYEFQASPGSVMQPTQSGTREINLNKGDTVTVEFVETLSGTLTLIGNTSSYPSYFSGHKLASPQTQLENETVAARYTSNSGQSIGTSIVVIKYEDIDFDYQNSYNISTGQYAIEVTGVYNINAKYETSNTAWTAGGSPSIYIYINGVALDHEYFRVIASSTMYISVSINAKLKLSKEDILTIRADSTTATTMGAGSTRNTFSITRVK